MILSKREILAAATVWLCFLLLLSPALAKAPADAVGRTERLAILGALKTADYGKLEAFLLSYETAFAKGEITDLKVRGAYGVFENSDDALETQLTKWVQARPTSHVPLLARGSHFRHVGWLARSAEARRKVGQGSFKSMDYYRDLARDDFMAALKIEPKASLAYGMLIRLSFLTRRSDTRIERWLAKGLTAVPGSVFIRYMYLRVLRSNWRGGVAAAESYIEKTRAQFGDDERFRRLYDFGTYVRADELADDEKREQALGLINKALSHNKSIFLQMERAKLYSRLNNKTAAMADLNSILKEVPDHDQALDYRSTRHLLQGNLDAALKDIDQAVELDRYNPRLLTDRAEILAQQGKTDAALRDYNDALRYGAGKPFIRSDRAEFFHKLERYEDAVAEYQAAVTLDPKAPYYWLQLYRNQDLAGDCGAADSFDKHAELCGTATDLVCAQRPPFDWMISAWKMKVWLTCTEREPNETTPATKPAD